MKSVADKNPINGQDFHIVEGSRHIIALLGRSLPLQKILQLVKQPGLYHSTKSRKYWNSAALFQSSTHVHSMIECSREPLGQREDICRSDLQVYLGMSADFCILHINEL